MGHSNGAVKTAFDVQVGGKLGPGRPKMTLKQLTEGLQKVEALMIDIPGYLV